MILDNVGLLLAPTVRSSIYLQHLLRNNLIPATAIVLGDTAAENSHKPGQLSLEKITKLKTKDNSLSDFDLSVSIHEILNDNDIAYHVCAAQDVNHNSVIARIENCEPNYFIYSGYGGVILKENILSCGKKFIHSHTGAMPKYRGSTTIYYSILKEDRCFVTVFLMSRGIDKGPVLLIKSYPKPVDGESIDYLYDPFIRADSIVKVIKQYVEVNEFKQIKQSDDEGEMYFIIHPVLKHIAILSCK